jgi:acyl-CoA synthetase (NDP forming)
VGLVTAEGIVVADEDEASAVADRLGFPVVTKIANEGATHKSDQGGVILNITSQDELEDAMRNLRKIGAVQFLIQRQITEGVEIYLGLQSQPNLGTFVILGLGGIWTELLDDVQIRPVGLLEGEAHEMIRELRGYKRLTGARGTEPVDLDLIADCIMRVDALGASIGDLIESLDINPIIVKGNIAIAVDALLVRRS